MQVLYHCSQCTGEKNTLDQHEKFCSNFTAYGPCLVNISARHSAFNFNTSQVCTDSTQTQENSTFLSPASLFSSPDLTGNTWRHYAIYCVILQYLQQPAAEGMCKHCSRASRCVLHS